MALSPNQSSLVNDVFRVWGITPGSPPSFANVNAATKQLVDLINTFEKDETKKIKFDPAKGYTPELRAVLEPRVAELDKKELELNLVAGKVKVNVMDVLSGYKGSRLDVVAMGAHKMQYEALNLLIGIMDVPQGIKDKPDTLPKFVRGGKDIFDAMDVIRTDHEAALAAKTPKTPATPTASANKDSSPKIDLSQSMKPVASHDVASAAAPRGPMSTVVERRMPDGTTVRMPLMNYNVSAAGSGAAGGTPGVTTSETFKLQDGTPIQPKTDSGPAEGDYSYGVQKKGSITYIKEVEDAQKLMLELAAASGGALKIDLGTFGKNKDGADGKFGDKTQIALQKVQEFLVGQNLQLMDGKITPQFMDQMKKRLESLKADPAATAGAAAPGATAGASAGTAAGTGAPAAGGDAGKTADAPTEKVDPAVLAAASETAEKGLGIFAQLFTRARLIDDTMPPVSAPGTVDGQFDPQSLKSLKETLVAMGMGSDPYTPEMGAQLIETLKTHKHKAIIEQELAVIGGADKLVEAFNTLHKAGSLSGKFNQVTNNFPMPAFNQQQGNLVAWAVGRDKNTAEATNELMRIYLGHGLEDVFPAAAANVPALNREGREALPPKGKNVDRVTQTFKEMLDNGVRFEDAQKKIMENMEAVFQAAGYPERAGEFRKALKSSFAAADATINKDETNENIANAFRDALEANWDGPHAKYPTTFQAVHIHPNREKTIAQSAYYAVPGEVPRREGTNDKLGYVDVFEAHNKHRSEGNREPIVFKAANGDLKIVTLGPRTNLITVETITAKELAEMQDIIKNGKIRTINGDPTKAGWEGLNSDYAAIHEKLVAHSAAYRVIRENHGNGVLNSDPRVFLETLSNAKTLDDLRAKVNGLSNNFDQQAQGIEVKSQPITPEPVGVGMHQHTPKDEIKGTVHQPGAGP